MAPSDHIASLREAQAINDRSGSDWRPQAPFRRPTAAQAAALGPEMGVPLLFIAVQAMLEKCKKPSAQRGPG